MERHKCNVQTTNGTATSRVLSDAVTGQALDLTDASGSTAAFLVDGIGNRVGALTDTGSNAFQVSYDGSDPIGDTTPMDIVCYGAGLVLLPSAIGSVLASTECFVSTLLPDDYYATHPESLVTTAGGY